MEHEFDVQLARHGVVAARRVVARLRARLALGEHDAVRAHHWQHRALGAGRGEKHLDMVVEGA
ncbi:hypothetical protein D3C85_1436080 [compost metagenome]